MTLKTNLQEVLTTVLVELEDVPRDTRFLALRCLLALETSEIKVDLTPAIREEIMACMRNGSKIQAIKTYRTAVGCGLREAKEAVEAMV